MNTRRTFIRQLSAAVSAAGLSSHAVAPASAAPAPAAPPADDRACWVRHLVAVAGPVLGHMAENKLMQSMPVEAPAAKAEGRRPFTHLEALGRTLTGVAPWLELQDRPDTETTAAERLAVQARQSIANAVDPAAADFIHFTAGAQNLVDAAFLCHAMVRAPRELWGKLDPAVQRRVIAAVQSTRKFKPGQNNWLLFAAMIEAFLARAGAEWREEAIDVALQAHEAWYKGDGVYGDGPQLHWDYYNSFVIQPMLIDVLEQIGRVTPKWSALLPKVLSRARRYAAIQERLIAPDGTYPAIGRSIAYRCGAFQLLSQMALRGDLPPGVAPAQVRSGLSAVLRRTLGAPGTFDANGWLRVGLAGHQPGLAEGYISTGSLYLCSAVFLPLGLPAAHPFWSGAATDWTMKKLWGGADGKADHAV